MNNQAEAPDPQDAELLAAIARGDAQAFSCFYDRFSGTLFSIAMGILRDPAQAEDLLQEVFLQIWERASHFDPELGKPLSWAVAMTRNKAIDRLRGSQRRQRVMDEMTETASSDFLSMDLGTIHGLDHDATALVRRSLQTLPEEQRKAIELAFFQGLSHGEIAEKLNAPLGTVKARIRRGMIQLRDELRDLI